MCCPAFVKKLWATLTFPNYFYYPEDVRGKYAAPGCSSEVFVWAISLSPAVIMATFLWGYTSVLSAMLCFHFVSCLLLPLVFICVMDCRWNRAAVTRFLRRKFCLRSFLHRVPPFSPESGAARCCSRIRFEALPQSAEAQSSARPVTVAEEKDQDGANRPQNATDTEHGMGDTEAKVDAAPDAAALAEPKRKPVRNGLLLCLAVIAWVVEAGVGMLLAYIFSIVDVLWDDIMAVIVDTVHSRYAVTTGGQAIFIGVWFSFVNPVLEELFWRGFLGERAPPRYRVKTILCSTAYASYHLLVTIALAPTAFSDMNIWLGVLVFFAMIVNGIFLDFLYSKYGLWVATIVHSGQDTIVMVVFLYAFFEFLPQLAEGL